MSMLTATRLAKFFVERDRQLYAIDGAPEPEPAPPKPEPIPKNETYHEMLQRRIRDDVRAGRAVSMNEIARSIPRVRPPRAPGQQRLRWNGWWLHY